VLLLLLLAGRLTRLLLLLLAVQMTRLLLLLACGTLRCAGCCPSLCHKPRCRHSCLLHLLCQLGLLRLQLLFHLGLLRLQLLCQDRRRVHPLLGVGLAVAVM
jgi:hypothetical protein